MNYFGTDVIVTTGDVVQLENEVLTVEKIIEGQEMRTLWDLDEDGLLLKGGGYGRVFVNVDDPELEFVRREGDE